MSYTLGIDLGTTFTAAAVMRGDKVEIQPLGNHAATIPSMVYLRDDEQVLIGDAAERRGVQDPQRLAKEFKRRLGDSTPILLDRTPFSAERLMALMLKQVIGDVSQRQGGAPSAIAVAHPANWGQFKIDLLRQAVQLSGSGSATLITEPVAAAVHYASTERVDPGDIVAVYDLGGGTFDAAVLRKTADGFETLGEPQGIERLGGIDFDESVMAHVRGVLGATLDGLDANDPSVRAALVRLRQECVATKEALSADSDASVNVLLPNVHTQVRLTRNEFEDMIRPTLRETVDSLRRAITNAGITPADVRAVVLAGGSSRIPLVAEMVRGEIGRPVVTDAHPKHSVALGAARHAASSTQLSLGAVATRVPVAAPPVTSPAAVPPAPAAPPAAPIVAPPVAATQALPVQPVARTPQPDTGWATSTQHRGSNTGKFIAVAAAVLALAGVGTWLLTRDDASTASSGDTTTGESTGRSNDADPVTTGDRETVPATDPPATDPPTTDPPPSETCGASGRCVGIESITLEGGTYVVRYTFANFDNVISPDPGDTDSHHVHFTWEQIPAEEMGAPGSGPWELWDLAAGGGDTVFTAFTTDNVADYAGENSNAICIAVATSGHFVEPDTRFCKPVE